jgi:glycosyltransferase involved in cell wall biosynthesis
MKIIIHSNAPYVSTGYGNQTRVNAPRINQDHDVAISAFHGLAGAQLQWNGITIYGTNADRYGNDILPAHAARHFQTSVKDGLVITLIDIWVLSPAILQRLNVAHWVPIDHEPVPPLVVEVIHQGGGVPIAMTRFGSQQLAMAGIESLYVPHCVESSNFKPIDRSEARAKIGMDQDMFLIGMVSANKGNPSRKSFPEALSAYAKFLSRRKATDPKCVLYLHSEAYGIWEGINLYGLIDHLGIPHENIAFCDQYQNTLGFSDVYMNYIYNSMDVLLCPSMGEGFGIPILEAQMCGTPVIVTDFSAMSEIGATGWKVKGQKFYTPQNAWQMVPNINELTEAMEKALENARLPKKSKQLREKAHEFAMNYDADLVYDKYWKPALAHLEETLVNKPRDFAQALQQVQLGQSEVATETRTESGLILPPGVVAPVQAKSPFLGRSNG